MPEESIPQNRLIVLELQASAPQAISAYATVIFDVASSNDEAITSIISFREPYHTGSYTEEDGLLFDAIVSLSEGYDDTVTFDLEGGNCLYNSCLLVLLIAMEFVVKNITDSFQIIPNILR